ncbi:MAG: hypothetical protein R3B09_12420 [Nannocystaceae bacterium]
MRLPFARSVALVSLVFVAFVACAGDPPAGTGESATTGGATSDASGDSTTVSTATTGEGTGGSATTTGGSATTTGGSATTTTAGETTTSSTSTTTTDSTTGDDAPLLPTWEARRGYLHVHSAYSHDACDGEGLMNGVPNKPCVDDLRAALCAAGVDFALLTDHPSFMRDYPFDELLHPRPGDALVDEEGAPIANHMTCPDDHVVVLAVGYESTHTLPLGLHHHVAAEFYAGLGDADPLDQDVALVAALQAAGAVVGIAHSEEDDLSAGRIIDVGLDAMEWYNPHGNFKTALGGDSIGGDPGAVLDLLKGLLPFMAGSNSGAHPDLVYLRLLPSWPVEGFAKWREVLRTRPITGLFGSDVHQNVRVDPICAQKDPLLQAACVAAAEAVLPEALAGLVSGGTLTMSDGDRLDAYARIFRWLDNRVLVDPDAEFDLAAIQGGLRAGRSFGVFSIFGGPEGFGVVAEADGEVHQLGATVGTGAQLRVRTPTRPSPEYAAGPQWSAAEGDAAAIRAIVVHTDARGSEEVAEVTTLATLHELELAAPGAYHVEIWVRPQHLKAALGDQAALADVEYLWVITNPILVAP